MEVGELFRQGAHAPNPINRFVLSGNIWPVFQNHYGASWQKYFRAWKGNFGYGAVVDDGVTNPAIKYNANVQWALDLTMFTQFIPPGSGSPPGCNAQLQGCPGCPTSPM